LLGMTCLAGSNLGVERIDPTRTNPHQHLARRGNRAWTVDLRKGPIGMLHNVGAHGILPVRWIIWMILLPARSRR
jgi:hypothetical protein